MDNNPVEKRKRGYYIFRTYYTNKNGERVYARDFGHKAWRFWISVDR